MFQSLSRDSGRLNVGWVAETHLVFTVFQSLSRDSGRLNPQGDGLRARGENVSIPQSGFGAFEPK